MGKFLFIDEKRINRILCERAGSITHCDRVCLFTSFFFTSSQTFLASKHGKWLLISGLAGNGIPAFLFALAQTSITSGLSGMLNSLTPLFTLLIAVVFFKVRIRFIKVIGVLIGLCGTLALVYVSTNVGASANYWYSLLVVGATLCYGISVNVLKEKLYELDAALITSLAFITIGPACLTYLLFATPVVETIQTEAGQKSLLYIAILSVFGTAFAVILFNKLIKHTSSVFASSVTYLIPIVAVFWGFIDGEVITGLQIGMFTIILSGVALVMRSDQK